MKLRPAASVTGVPVPDAVSTVPVESVRSDVAPLVCTVTLVAFIEATDSDWALVKAKAPIVPELEIATTRLAPVRLTVPAPLSASVVAVMIPVPFRVAPEATAVVAVPLPTFQLPERVSVPALTVVEPV